MLFPKTFYLNTKINMLFKCDCNEKQYTLKTNTIKNIIQHIKIVNILL
jgi:hypothetical protein